MRKSLAKRLTNPIVDKDGRLTTNNGKNPTGSQEAEYLPSPKQIKYMTRLIQRTWDEETRIRRRYGNI